MIDNTDNQTAKRWSMPSLGNARDYISMMDVRKKEIQNNEWASQQENRINSSLSLHEHGIATSNEDLKNQYDKGSRMEEAAGMISAFNGATGDFKKVIKDFINENDDERGSMYNAFYDYIQKGDMTTGELADLTINKIGDIEYNPYQADDSQEKAYTPFGLEDDTGYEAEESSTLADMAQPVIDLATQIPVSLNKGKNELLKWLLKELGADESEVDNYFDSLSQEMDDDRTLPNVDRDDLAYILSDFAVDVPVSAVIAFALKNPEYAVLRWGTKWKKLEKAIKSYPKIANILAGSYRGGRDMTILNALNGEVDLGDTAFGMLLGGGGTTLLNTKMGKGLSNRFQTDGVMTTTRMKRIIDGIKDTVSKVPTLSDVADFMTKHGITGSQSAIVKKARAVYKQAMSKVDGIFSKIEGTSYSEAAKDAVDWLIERITKKDAPEVGKKAILDTLKKFQEKAGNFTAMEKEKIKRIMDDEISDMFTAKGEVAEGYKYIVKTRGMIQKELEEIGKDFGDIAMLNNEVRTAFGIMKGAEERLSYEGVSKGIAKYGIPGLFALPAYKKLREGDYAGALMQGIWPIVASSKRLKTHLGSLANRLSGTNRYEFTQRLTKEGKEALSEGASKEMAKLLEGDKSFKEWLKELGVYFIENLLIKSTGEASKATESMLGEVQTDEFNPEYSLDKN